MFRSGGVRFAIRGGSKIISWKLKKKAKERLSKEKGTVFRDRGGRVSVCLVYPNTYFLGMSNLGFQTVYRLFNSLDRCVCERAFLPDREDFPEFERSSTPLFSLETQSPLASFDIIAFSISFEEDFLNVPKILGLAKVPLLSKDRDDTSPLVTAGGVAVSLNPEPVAPFFDLFLIGEGEGLIGPFIDTFVKLKERGAGIKKSLKDFAAIEGVYVPSLYEFVFDGAVTKEIRPAPGAPPRVKARKAKDPDIYPVPESVIITPETEFGATGLLEVERGCGRQCRFCAAGFLYLPPRMRSKEAVKDALARAVERSGRVGLVGAAVSEYPYIKDMIREGVAAGGEVTLSSLRADMLDGEFLSLLKEAGLKTVTIAPEAGSERLRRVVNKSMTDSEILDAARLVKDAGFRKVKLYFMLGLPTETDEDARAIGGLAVEIKDIMKGGEVILSINPFIPKPFTPFQWHGLEDISNIERRFSIVKDMVRRVPKIDIKSISLRDAFLQACLSRGDRRAASFIIEASERGVRAALKSARPRPEDYVYRKRKRDELFPWEILDHGIERSYLWKEYQRGLEGRLTPPCDVGRCFRCGVC